MPRIWTSLAFHHRSISWPIDRVFRIPLVDLLYVSPELPWWQAVTGTMMVKAGQRVAPSLALHVATARGPAERAAPLQPPAAQPVAPLRERQGGWPLLPPGRCTAQAPAGDPGPRQGMRPACAGPPLVRVPARLPRASGTAGVQAPAGGAAPRPCPQRRRLQGVGGPPSWGQRGALPLTTASGIRTAMRREATRSVAPRKLACARRRRSGATGRRNASRCTGSTRPATVSSMVRCCVRRPHKDAPAVARLAQALTFNEPQAKSNQRPLCANATTVST